MILIAMGFSALRALSDQLLKNLSARIDHMILFVSTGGLSRLGGGLHVDGILAQAHVSVPRSRFCFFVFDWVRTSERALFSLIG